MSVLRSVLNQLVMMNMRWLHGPPFRYRTGHFTILSALMRLAATAALVPRTAMASSPTSILSMQCGTNASRARVSGTRVAVNLLVRNAIPRLLNLRQCPGGLLISVEISNHFGRSCKWVSWSSNRSRYACRPIAATYNGNCSSRSGLPWVKRLRKPSALTVP